MLSHRAQKSILEKEENLRVFRRYKKIDKVMKVNDNFHSLRNPERIKSFNVMSVTKVTKKNRIRMTTFDFSQKLT